MPCVQVPQLKTLSISARTDIRDLSGMYHYKLDAEQVLTNLKYLKIIFK
jgi:hypothetical protein